MTDDAEPDVPWDTGSQYWYGWLIFDIVLITGVFLNLAVIGFTTFNKTIRRSFVSPAVRYLAIEDLAFSLFCFLQCFTNLTGSEYLGAWAACRFQAIYLTLFILATGYSLVFYAYVCKNRIVNFSKKVDWERQALKFHIASWSWCFFLGILCTFITRPQLLQSGLACLIDLRQWWNFLAFSLFGIVTMVVMLAWQYRAIIKAVRKHHEEVAKCFKHVSTSSRSTQNTAGQVRSTRRGSRDNMRALLFRVTLFVSVFVICAGPIFIMSVINLVNGTPTSPKLDLVVGTATHFQSTVNPVLYFALHPHHRRETVRVVQRFFGLSVLQSSDGVSGGSSDNPSVEQPPPSRMAPSYTPRTKREVAELNRVFFASHHEEGGSGVSSAISGVRADSPKHIDSGFVSVRSTTADSSRHGIDSLRKADSGFVDARWASAARTQISSAPPTHVGPFAATNGGAGVRLDDDVASSPSAVEVVVRQNSDQISHVAAELVECSVDRRSSFGRSSPRRKEATSEAEAAALGDDREESVGLLSSGDEAENPPLAPEAQEHANDDAEHALPPGRV